MNRKQRYTITKNSDEAFLLAQMVQEVSASDVSFNPIEMFFSVNLHFFQKFLKL